ncbi:hypothetical protein BUQ74_06675 [Leptospira weilii serovar Heyan]|nr:hypothetical protein BUQ74_06675 [Leptospira weilii serovar Heyan]
MKQARRGEGREGKFGRFFSIRKSYFLQVKSLILVGTLEKYQFSILIIPKAFLICGVGYDTGATCRVSFYCSFYF